MNERSGPARLLAELLEGIPFPWQEELLNSFLYGAIPVRLDIPTGLGKTAVMPIWLVARISGARLPRRLVYIVDRRAVVDQATEVAVALRRLVDSKPELKSKLGLQIDRSLPISTLRGQHVDNREWLEDPSAPAIIVATVDMAGSRLLFEGYGISRKMRPYHAGLMGADVLVVLDEAHLVPPFEKLLEAMATRIDIFGPCTEALRQVVPGFKLLSLSATGRSSGDHPLALTDKDLQHPIVRKRLEAKKRLSIVPLSPESDGSTDVENGTEGNSRKEKKTLADALAWEAWKLTGNGKQSVRVVIFCDSRKVAEETKSAVERLARTAKNADGKSASIDIDPEFFVGGRRVFERDQAKDRLAKLGFIAGSEVTRTRPAFLFATSAAEVGVDLDADHMVCDLVAWERMIQRLGRVNRRGDGDATVVVVVEPEPKPGKKEKAAIEKRDRGEELEDKERDSIKALENRLLRWKSYRAPFERLPQNDGKYDASPGALRGLKLQAESNEQLRRIIEDATTPDPLRPQLTRALVDAWSMTSLEKHTGRPAIDPWLRGWLENDPPQTAVVWRLHLPVRSGPHPPAKKEIEAFFEAAPPHVSEVLETETFLVRQWLERRGKVTGKRDGGQTMISMPGEEDVVAFALSRAGDLRRTLSFRDFLPCNTKDEEKTRKESLDECLRGGTLIVDARLAGLKDGLLNDGEDTPPRTGDDGQQWLGESAIRFRIRSTDSRAAITHTSWRERLRFPMDLSEDGETRSWLVVEKWRDDAATEEDRSSSRPQLLEEHQAWAEDRARTLAQRLLRDQLPDSTKQDYVEMLAIAARLHDEGKRALRWQRSFNAKRDGVYAKTMGPINYALLDGYRHELGSLSYAEQDEGLKRLPEDLRDLALHLIAAHHGFARPVIGIQGCDDAPPSVVEKRARDVALRFARLQRRWGAWGLAWWEALVRAADQQASRDNEISELAAHVEAG